MNPMAIDRRTFLRGLAAGCLKYAVALLVVMLFVSKESSF